VATQGLTGEINESLKGTSGSVGGSVSPRDVQGGGGSLLRLKNFNHLNFQLRTWKLRAMRDGIS